MDQKELESALQSIKEVKEMLSRKRTYFIGLWQFFVFLSLCVIGAYTIMQLMINTKNLRYSAILWIVFGVLLVLYPFVSVWRLRKKGISASISFKNLPAATTLFIVFASVFVQSLPPRLSPFAPNAPYATWIPNMSYTIWLFSYAIIEFVTGYYFTAPEFFAASVITLVGIPITLLFRANLQVLIEGLFLGLPLLISSLVELKRKGEEIEQRKDI